jgi:hypothetical protein
MMSAEEIAQVRRDNRELTAVHAQQHRRYRHEQLYVVQVIGARLRQEEVQHRTQREKNKVRRFAPDVIRRG